MNKKVGIIAAIVVIAIVVLAIVLFMMKGNNKVEQLIDSPQTVAEEIYKNDPSKTVDEWKEIGDQELTEEQKQVAAEIFIDTIPEVDKVTDANPDTNEVTFIDVNGNEWIMEADPEIAEMTDEEAEAYIRQTLDNLGSDDDDDDLRVNFDNNSINFPSSNNQSQPQVDTNYEDVNINDGLDWSNSEVGQGHGSVADYDPDTALWTDPYAGMTPEEKEAQIRADQEATQKIVDGDTGIMS